MDAYLRVIFVDRDWEELLDEVKLKRTCSSEITNAALDFFNDYCQNFNTQSTIELENEAKNIGYFLIHWGESKAAGNVISRIISKTFFKKEYFRIADLKQTLKDNVKYERSVVENSWLKISRYMDTILKEGSTVLVHAYSSTVCKVLSNLKKRLHVYVTESRPLSDGRRTIQSLLDASDEDIAKITLIPDSGIAKVLSSVDACIVGADTIFKNGSFINKIGTHAITLCANEMGVNVYVLSDTMKVSKATRIEIEESSREKCFYDEDFSTLKYPRLEEIETMNSIYEVTPPMDIVSFITDIGKLSRTDIADCILRIEEYRTYSSLPV